jgi:hypothetical protein
MKRQRGMIYAGLCTLAMTSAIVAPAGAQTSEVKEKPPMYSYISNWDIPRAQWSEMAKADEADRPALEKALASSTLVGYGNDVNLIHRADGETHDQWWSARHQALGRTLCQPLLQLEIRNGQEWILPRGVLQVKAGCSR